MKRLVRQVIGAAAAPLLNVMVTAHRDILRSLLVEEGGVLRELVLAEAGHILRDIEWRYAQARDLVAETTGLALLDTGRSVAVLRRQLTAEDLCLGDHRLTGFTVSANSPGAGSIAWASLHIVYQGTDYTITDNNTNLKYAYWVKATSTTTLQTSNTKPTLGVDDVMVFINNSGTPTVMAQDSGQSMPGAVANNAVDALGVINGAIGTTQLANNAVTTAILASGAVTSAILGSGAVTSAALGAGAVGTAALASGAVTSAILGTGAVTSGALAAGAVGTAAIAAGAVTASLLGSGAVTAAKLNIQQHTLY